MDLVRAQIVTYMNHKVIETVFSVLNARRLIKFSQRIYQHHSSRKQRNNINKKKRNAVLKMYIKIFRN